MRLIFLIAVFAPLDSEIDIGLNTFYIILDVPFNYIIWQYQKHLKRYPPPSRDTNETVNHGAMPPREMSLHDELNFAMNTNAARYGSTEPVMFWTVYLAIVSYWWHSSNTVKCDTTTKA